MSNEKNQLGVMNANVPSVFYQHSPCRIGFSYLRMQVDGLLKPCCVSDNINLGSIHENTWEEIWFSDQYNAFREKTGRIHLDRYHLKDPDWGFCQQCPHIEMNVEQVRARKEGEHEKSLRRRISKLIRSVLARLG